MEFRNIELRRFVSSLLRLQLPSRILIDSFSLNIAIASGMLTVSDIVHLIQYYWHTLTYEEAAADVEHFRLENLQGLSSSS